MTIRSLSLAHFMNIDDAHLEFQKGINILAGEFGQGKSAVLEAIAFCLLKDHKRGDTAQDFLQRGQDWGKVEMVVQMSENPDDIMEFEIQMKQAQDPIKKVTYKGVPYSPNSVYNEFLEKAIDQDMLKNITFLMQNGTSINDMAPAVRRDVFKKIFNSEFPAVIAKIEEDTKTWKKKEEDKKIQIEALKLKTYQPQRLIEVDPGELDELRAELKLAQGFDLEKAKYDTFLIKKTQLDAQVIERAGLELEILAHSNKLAEIKTTVSKKETDLSGAEDILSGILDLLRAWLIESDVLRGAVTKATEAKKKLEETSPVAGLNTKIEALRTSIATATARGTVLKMHKEAHEKGECTQCGQKTNTGKVPEIEAEMVTLRETITAARTSITQLESDIETHRAEITAAIAAINAEEKKVSEDTLKNSRKQAEKTAQERVIEGIKAEIQRLKTDTTKAENDAILKIGEKIDKLEISINTLSPWVDTNKMDEPVRSGRISTEIQGELDGLIAEVANNAAKITFNENLKVEQKTDAETMTKYSQEINEIKMKIKRLGVLAKYWGTEFPNFIGLSGCEILQNQMNGFFDKNRKGFTVKLTQTKKGIDFSYRVGEDDIYGPSKMASGFESAMLTLSFKVAVARVSGSPLIFLDEPDAAADGEASIRVFDTIQNIGQFEQQFVITHKPDAIKYMKEGGALVYYVKEGVFSNYE